MARLKDALLGHEEIWHTLLRRSELGRLPHALAFVGPSGIGKKHFAWAFAQALVCEAAAPPCGECPACRRVENHQSESVLFLEPEKGTIKLDAAHQILQFLTLQRLGRARVVIIDSAQSLNPQAANSLLKAIEEPPPQTFFILIASELSQLLPTLRSRLQVLRFSPLNEEQIQQGEKLPTWMVRSARGSFEQLETFRDPQSEELRSLAFDFLTGALHARRVGLDALLDHAKDRESSLKAIHFLQQLLRDWTLIESAELIHSDLSTRFTSLPALAAEKRVDLWRSAFQMEQDLIAHVDRGLIFENFFYRAHQALG